MNKFESGLLIIICLLLLVIGVVTSNLSVSLFALFISLLLWKKNQKMDIHKGGKSGNRDNCKK